MSGATNEDLSTAIHKKLRLQQNSIIRKLVGKQYAPSKPIKDAAGNKLTRHQVNLDD